MGASLSSEAVTEKPQQEPIISRSAPQGKLRVFATKPFDGGIDSDVHEWVGDYPVTERAFAIGFAVVCTKRDVTIGKVYDEHGVLVYPTKPTL